MMVEGKRVIHLVSTDESLIASTRTAVEGLGEWEVHTLPNIDELLADLPQEGDAILLDAWARTENVYEVCRGLTGQTKSRTFIVTDRDGTLAEPIARFCGATGVITRPVSISRLRTAFETKGGTARVLPSEHRGEGRDESQLLPEELLVDIEGKPDSNLVTALVDPETSLFNYAFLHYKLDEEFKRSQRFGHPLSCVMLGFEGQAETETLQELASIFLLASRDTDILGRFDENSFLFFLPNTGPDGAAIMARRIDEAAEKRGLKDLVGDPMTLSVGIAHMPSGEIERAEDLFATARQAFVEARADGGGVVCGG